MNVESKVILIVGKRRSGKTTDLRNMLKDVHPEALLLHDISSQFTDLYKKPFLPIREFTKLCKKVSSCVIAFEEATIFIGHHKLEDVAEFLVTSRHRKNTIIFIFHSLRSVPRYIYDLSNMVILHKTQDSLSFVQGRFEDENLNAAFVKVNSMASPYASVIHRLDE
jgi:ABC-type sugar transport system ATPase subunit